MLNGDQAERVRLAIRMLVGAEGWEVGPWQVVPWVGLRLTVKRGGDAFELLWPEREIAVDDYRSVLVRAAEAIGVPPEGWRGRKLRRVGGPSRMAIARVSHERMQSEAYAWAPEPQTYQAAGLACGFCGTITSSHSERCLAFQRRAQ